MPRETAFLWSWLGVLLATGGCLFAPSSFGAETFGNAAGCILVRIDKKSEYQTEVTYRNTCVHSVHAHVETEGRLHGFHSQEIFAGPRGTGQVYNPSGRAMFGNDVRTHVFVACLSFRVGDQQYGIDPDDYTRCLTLEDIDDLPVEPPPEADEGATP